MIINIRDFFGAYYSADPVYPRMWHGVEMLHVDECGRYVDSDGAERMLVCIRMSPEVLPDTMGRNCEMCDFAIIYSDIYQQPEIITTLLSGQADAIELALLDVAPSVRLIVLRSLDAGMSAWEIIDHQAGILVEDFLGFTFDEVLLWRPDILQPVTVDDQAEQQNNIRRSSLEERE